MFLTKLKIATALVLGMGLLGISWGLCPTHAAVPNEANQEAAPPPPSTSATADKEGGNSANKDQSEKKIGLPKGLPPVQALVSLTKDGKLRVKCKHMMMIAKRGAGMPPLPGGPMPGPHVVIRANGGGKGAEGQLHDPLPFSYDLKEVQVLDTTGKKVEKQQWMKLVKDETLAVVAFGEVDPLHLRILKEGTLVFLLPPPTAGAVHLPDGDHVWFPGSGSVMAPFFFFRTRPVQRFDPESCEP